VQSSCRMRRRRVPGNGAAMLLGLRAEVRGILPEWSFLFGHAADAFWLGSQVYE
jgi:hypothetical protein